MSDLTITIIPLEGGLLSATLEAPAFVDDYDGFDSVDDALEWVRQRLDRHPGDPFAG